MDRACGQHAEKCGGRARKRANAKSRVSRKDTVGLRTVDDAGNKVIINRINKRNE